MRVTAWVAAALLGGALVLLELSLTRLYSFFYSGNRGFVILALASAGLAAGALVTHRVAWRPERRVTLAFAGAAGTGALALAYSAALAAGIAIVPAGLSWLTVWCIYAAAGTALAALYTSESKRVGGVAACQLGGMALAASVAPGAMERLGPPNTVSLAVSLMGGAAVTLGARSAFAGRAQARPLRTDYDDSEGPADLTRHLGTGALVLVALVSLMAWPLDAATGWSRIEPARIPSSKALFAAVRSTDGREQIVYSRWHADLRVDVTETPQAPDVRWVYQDGAFVGPMHRSSASGEPPAGIRGDIGFLPYLLPGPRDKVLVAGTGSGHEVLMALAGGASEVVVTRDSGGLVDAGRALAQYNGNLVGRSAVRVVDQDTRTFLRSSGEQFDIIHLTPAAAGPAHPGGVVARAHLYTLDAFADYVDALRPAGRLVIPLRGEEDLLRAFNTAFQVSVRRGSTPVEAIRRLLAVNNQPVAERRGGGIALPLLTLRKAPYSEDEARAAVDMLSASPFPPIFAPHFEAQSPLAAFAVDELGPPAIEAAVPYDVTPTTDARPFFFAFDRGVPWLLVLAPLALALVTGALALLCRRPSWEHGDPATPGDEEAAAFLEDDVPVRFLWFAAASGTAWGMLLVPLLHRAPQLAGQQSIAASLVYGATFAGAAAGSLLVARARVGTFRPIIGWSGLAGGVLGVALLEVLPMLSHTVLGLDAGIRLIVVSIVLAPLGLCLGVLFPGAIRLLDAAGRGSWTALVFGVFTLSAACSAVFAYALATALGLAGPALVGSAALFGTFLMAGLRVLPVPVDGAPERSEAPSDHSAFRRPAAQAPRN